GHATLATAHVLWQDGHLPPEAPAIFHTRSGILTAVRDGEWIELDFPADPVEAIDPPQHLDRALGAPIVRVGRARYDLLVEIPSEKEVRTIHPNHTLLASFDARGVIVTSPSVGKHFDFVSRFFAPRVGIVEDPVTGSAHCTLASYWSRRLGREQLVGYQVSQRGGAVRGAVLRNERARLAVQAVTVMRGTVRLCAIGSDTAKPKSAGAHAATGALPCVPSMGDGPAVNVLPGLERRDRSEPQR